MPAIERQTYSLSRALIEPLYIEPYSMSSNLENDQIETRSENLTSFLHLCYSVTLRPGYIKQSLSLHESLCRDLKLPQFPLSKLETHPPTCLTDGGEIINF